MDHGMIDGGAMTFTSLDVVAIALGVLAILLAVLLVAGRSTWDESAKYEMLGQAPPDLARRPIVPGRLGVEDRLVRFGLGTVGLYYAVSRLGPAQAAGVVLGLAGLYLLVTCAVGRDWLYRRLGFDTRLPEQR